MSTTDTGTDGISTPTSDGTTARLSTDHAGLDVLPLAQCLHHLRAAQVGRVAFVHDGEPLILPVNHGLDGEAVVFRSSPGSKLAAAQDELPVAFEVDGIDVDRQTGWSVVVRGTATAVVDPTVIDRLDRLGVWPWARATERRHWVRIRAYEITGRRIPLRTDTITPAGHQHS